MCACVQSIVCVSLYNSCILIISISSNIITTCATPISGMACGSIQKVDGLYRKSLITRGVAKHLLTCPFKPTHPHTDTTHTHTDTPAYFILYFI